MTRIDIFSGFLGAGKTTLIKKLIKEAYTGEKLVLIENEFGDIGIDGGFLKESGIQITEMNSGCICCSLVGDFGKALNQVITDYTPDRILIEPSGVGKLSDVIAAVKRVETDQVKLGSFTTVVDATSCDIYMESFGEFYNNQIETASCIVLSRTDELSDEEIQAVVALLREHNKSATLITTPWGQLSGERMQLAIEQTQTLARELAELQKEEHHHEHHHHHHHEEEEGEAHEHHHEEESCGCHEHHHHEEESCDCHEHHHDEESCGCHEHHHHEEESCGCHEHHHHDEENCGCHEHHHHAEGECDDPDCGCHHHHDHDADEVFTSWGRETTRKFSVANMEQILHELDNKERFGMILRAKGIVAGEDGKWIHFDHVPGEVDVRNGGAEVIGRLCVIGSHINEKALSNLFGI